MTEVHLQRGVQGVPPNPFISLNL